MPEITYVAAEWRTGIVVADLTVTGDSFEQRLTASGEFTASLPLRQNAARLAEQIDSTVPWRFAVWALVDGVPAWGGPIIGRPYTLGSGAIGLRAVEPGGYFARRFIRRDYVATGVDQLAIARRLFADAAAEPGGDVGLIVDTRTSGVNRDRTYKAAQLKPLMEAVDEIANVKGGFDYGWGGQFVGNLLRPTLTFGYPTLGATPDNPRMLTYPGDVTAGQWDEDGTAFATASWAVGDRDTSTPAATALLAQTTNTGLLDAGFPLLDQSTSYSGITVPATLQGHADADLQAHAGVLLGSTLTIPLATLYREGIVVGDALRLLMRDGRFPADVDTTLRVVGVGVNRIAGTATLKVADRVLYGGAVPEQIDVPRLLGALARRVLRIEVE